MSKSKALIAAETERDELKLKLAELEQTNAALEARLCIARTVYRDQRAKIVDLESKLATRGCIDTTRLHVADDYRPENDNASPDEAAHKHEVAQYAALNCGIGYIKTTPKAIVTHFTKRDGTVWEKTRIGNRATMCEVTVHA